MSFNSTGQLVLKPDQEEIGQGDTAGPTETSMRTAKMTRTDQSTDLGYALETKIKVKSIHFVEMIELIMVWVD